MPSIGTVEKNVGSLPQADVHKFEKSHPGDGFSVFSWYPFGEG
jgi:hypothetical protein